MPTVSIIIPNYNGRNQLEECLASIEKHTSVSHEVIVVDNGSKDDSLDFCCRQKVKLISLPSNVGFPAACNYGMRMARGDVLVLLNNDVIVTRNWMNGLLHCLYSSEDVGIVGPITNYASGRQQITETFTNIRDMEHRLNGYRPDKWQQVERLIGFCMAIKRKVVDAIGILDERFSPGHFEDDDYCYRARQAGFRLLIAGDTFVYHHGSMSFNKVPSEEIKQLLQRNRQKFIDKWGVPPEQFM